MTWKGEGHRHSMAARGINTKNVYTSKFRSHYMKMKRVIVTVLVTSIGRISKDQLEQIIREETRKENIELNSVEINELIYIFIKNGYIEKRKRYIDGRTQYKATEKFINSYYDNKDDMTNITKEYFERIRKIQKEYGV